MILEIMLLLDPEQQTEIYERHLPQVPPALLGLESSDALQAILANTGWLFLDKMVQPGVRLWRKSLN
jgi:hypothetical protein